MNSWFLFYNCRRITDELSRSRDWSVSLWSVSRYGSTNERKHDLSMKQNFSMKFSHTSPWNFILHEVWSKGSIVEKLFPVHKHAFEYPAPDKSARRPIPHLEVPIRNRLTMPLFTFCICPFMNTHNNGCLQWRPREKAILLLKSLLK